MKDHRKPEPLCQCIQRKCMKCQKWFSSFGDHICESCQKKNRGLSVLGGKYVPRASRSKMVDD